MGAREKAMIGSARFSRSYGFTHGSIELHPADNTARADRTNKPRMRITLKLLFLEHRTNLREIEVLIAGLVALVHDAEVALAIDEHGARHAGDLVELADLALGVEGDRERDGFAELSEPRFGGLRIRLHVHREHGEAHGLVL